MFGIKFIKADPTTYVIHFRNGEVRREGTGRSFFYFGPNSSIVLIPAKSVDVPFIFNEVTSDFQTVAVQGQFSYRIVEPLKLAELLDFSIDEKGAFRSDDPELLKQRLTNVVRVLLREVVCVLPLEQALTLSGPTAKSVLTSLSTAEVVRQFGVEIIDFTILAVSATPEMSRALEATTRELLQKRSDEAIYNRRDAAVDQERIIKENELRTDVSVEEKKRLIRETKMAADIAVEEQRALLMEQKVANDRKEADSRAYGLEAILKPLKDADWKTLTAALSGNMKPDMMIATAFRELAENASRIGELNISPELLTSLMQGRKSPA